MSGRLAGKVALVVGGADAGPAHIDEQVWERILAVYLKSVILPCRSTAARAPASVSSPA